MLLKEPHLKSLEIVRRAKLAGYEGGKSALYAVIAAVRPRKSRPLGHQDKIPGEVVRHGFGQADIRFLDGRVAEVNFLVTRLEYSRWTAVSIVPDQGLETLVRALVRHYQAAWGVPFLATFDRSKPIAPRTDAEGHVLEWDSAFAYAMVQLGIGVEVRARRGAERGAGTNLANWVKQSFLQERVFADEDDLKRQLADWVGAVNSTTTPEAGDQTPLARLAEERQRLRPLRVTAETLALRFPVVVGPRATVLFEGRSYAMPPDSIGLCGVLHLYPDKVVVVAGRHEATHERHPTVPLPRPMPVTSSVSAELRPSL
ncbi:MAG TPA: hypothetical protein VHU40_03430 [Polyangia bacterium]|nr:hypothetical protein [Polyangia bacterium]